MEDFDGKDHTSVRSNVMGNICYFHHSIQHRAILVQSLSFREALLSNIVNQGKNSGQSYTLPCQKHYQEEAARMMTPQ